MVSGLNSLCQFQQSKHGDTTRMTEDITLWCHLQKYQTITNFIMDGNKGNN
jgi:hypothetical protein